MPATDTDPTLPGSTPPAEADSGAVERRSASLLPAGDDDTDDRFAVAEEVSLDQQSDAARRIGTLPPDPAPGANVSDALGATLTPAATGQAAPLRPDGRNQSAPPAPGIAHIAQPAPPAEHKIAHMTQPAPDNTTQTEKPASGNTMQTAQPPPDGTGRAQP